MKLVSKEKTDFTMILAAFEFMFDFGHVKGVAEYKGEYAPWSWKVDVWSAPITVSHTEVAGQHIISKDDGGQFAIEPGYSYRFDLGEEPPEPPEPPTPEPPEGPKTLEEWLNIFLDQPGYSDCDDYGLIILETDEPEYKVIGVHHLTGAENQGGHSIYVDVVDGNGNLLPDSDVKIRLEDHDWGWMGRASDSIPVWDCPIWKDDSLELTVGDYSEVVTGINTRHPDEEDGNTLYHHSFYIVFQKVSEEPPTPEPPSELPLPNSIHIYFGGIRDTPVVTYYSTAKFATFGIQRDKYEKLWKEMEEVFGEVMEFIG